VYLKGAETEEDCYRRSQPVMHSLNEITAPSYGYDSRFGAGGAEYHYQFAKKSINMVFSSSQGSWSIVFHSAGPVPRNKTKTTSPHFDVVGSEPEIGTFLPERSNTACPPMHLCSLLHCGTITIVPVPIDRVAHFSHECVVLFNMTARDPILRFLTRSPLASCLFLDRNTLYCSSSSLPNLSIVHPSPVGLLCRVFCKPG
jgi:hypothetical protein